MTDTIPPTPEVPPGLREAAQLTKLVPFVGAGASKLAGCPDWNEFAEVTALVCHATCLLLDTKLSNGELLVKGKTWTGFANSEEQFADNFVGKRIQPFWIEDES